MSDKIDSSSFGILDKSYEIYQCYHCTLITKLLYYHALDSTLLQFFINIDIVMQIKVTIVLVVVVK